MNNITIEQNNQQSYQIAGLFTLALRLVVGWTYFSAFWRRLFLANKLDPEAAGYIGEKFNHFLPNALGIQPVIEYLVTHPEVLWWAMSIFTIVEGIVGLLIMLGFFTRLMSIGVFSLAMGILLGSGWIGTTCLDEWQIGVLGIATGFTIFLSGGGIYSLDNYFLKRKYQFTKNKNFPWLSSGALRIKVKLLNKVVLFGAFLILFMTLFTNQHFHGGLWGTLHNKSVKPKIEIAKTEMKEGQLSFEVYRVEGVDVYGSFLIGIQILNRNDSLILDLDGEDLSKFSVDNIHNSYIAKVKPGKHSMIIPLGSRATLKLDQLNFSNLPAGEYTLKLVDISGLSWTDKITIQ